MMFGQICFLKVRLKVNYVKQVAFCRDIYMSIHLGQIKFKTLDCDPCRSGDFVYSADVKSRCSGYILTVKKLHYNLRIYMYMLNDHTRASYYGKEYWLYMKYVNWVSNFDIYM